MSWAGRARALTARDRREWGRMRRALWPDQSEADHEAEMVAWLARPDAAVIEAVSTRARGRGLHELASDALLDNARGQRAHEHVGFGEVERAVRYRKPLTADRVDVAT